MTIQYLEFDETIEMNQLPAGWDETPELETVELDEATQLIETLH